MSNNIPQLPEETENKKFRDEQTEKRILEHLNNKNDLISDQDLINVKTNIGEEESDVSTINTEDLSREDENNSR